MAYAHVGCAAPGYRVNVSLNVETVSLRVKVICRESHITYLRQLFPLNRNIMDWFLYYGKVGWEWVNPFQVIGHVIKKPQFSGSIERDK